MTDGTGGKPRLVRAAYIIVYQDGEHRLIKDGALLYRGNNIEYVGPARDFAGAHVVDCRSQILSPGFVSTHGHYAVSPFERGVREDWGNPRLYMTGLYEHASVLGQGITSEVSRTAALSSIAELVRSGVTTGLDFTAWPEETASAAEEVGFRAYIGARYQSASWQTDGRSVEYLRLDESKATRQFDYGLAFARQHQEPNSLIRGFLAPRQLDTCDPQLLQQTHQIAVEEGLKVQTHAAQTVLEFREMLKRTGRTPVEYMSDLGILDESLVIAHCVYVGGHSWLAYPGNDDVRTVAESGAAIADCPWAFARYGQGLESLSKYLAAGVRVSLGIDTVPQSMLSEMRIAATVGKFMERDARVATARQVFDAATLGGADALGRPDLGRLAPGCKADFCSYETQTPTMCPVRDPIKNIVYSATPADVSLVVINGHTVMEGSRFTRLDEVGLAHSMQEAAEQVWSDFPNFDHAHRSVDEMCPPSIAPWNPSPTAGT